MGLFDVFTRKQPLSGPREDLPSDVKNVVRILRKVKDPETGLDIVDEGLLYGITVEGRSVELFLLMARSTPECHFCQMLAINLQNKILSDIVEVLKQEGFNKIKIYNEIGLLLAEG
ncbi:iron-sulfur cluster assembly protein [Thermococcus aciditolerans]|uniref:Iron-sulfur cluster assembly protein n=1 Tax=Thermococcus aciditolerans TaxID=2598455 RepID=A0A5C0SHY7_9EURY|nr:iron-sulfur cluster assembly protein [Thermococcus aciditolerans]QEK14195.1 iron-sulfur cluster assembly protein [Thermococcus aciditolerans]